MLKTPIELKSLQSFHFYITIKEEVLLLESKEFETAVNQIIEQEKLANFSFLSQISLQMKLFPTLVQHNSSSITQISYHLIYITNYSLFSIYSLFHLVYFCIQADQLLSQVHHSCSHSTVYYWSRRHFVIIPVEQL